MQLILNESVCLQGASPTREAAESCQSTSSTHFGQLQPSEQRQSKAKGLVNVSALPMPVFHASKEKAAAGTMFLERDRDIDVGATNVMKSEADCPRHERDVDTQQVHDAGAFLKCNVQEKSTALDVHSTKRPPHKTQQQPAPNENQSQAGSSTSSQRRSHNPAGTTSEKTRCSFFETPELAKTMLYLCPMSDGSGGCPGLGLAEDACWGDVRQRYHDIKTERLRFCKKPGDEGLAQQLLNYFWANTCEGCDPIPLSEMKFSVGNLRVCHWCWSAAAGFVSRNARKKTSWAIAMTAYRNGTRTVDWHSSRVSGSSSSCSLDKGNLVMAWLSEHSKTEMGNTQQVTTDDSEHYQATTRQSLWKTMNEEMRERGTIRRHDDDGEDSALCSYSFFAKQVLKLNSMAQKQSTPMGGDESLVHVKFDKWCTQGECAICSAFKVMRRRAVTKGRNRELNWVDKLVQSHKECARQERLAYHQRIERSIIRWKTWGFAWDGYCKRKSSGMRMSGHAMADMKGIAGMSDAEQIVYHTVGVIAHGFGYFLYVAQPWLPSNANFTVECFHRTLLYMTEVLQDPNDDRITVPPDEIFIQVDGASDNKATVMFCYCCYLVKLGFSDLVVVSFLLVGHTHFDVDQRFAPITFQLRRACIKTIEDLIAEYWAAYQPESQPLKIEKVEAVGDYTHWLVENALKFAGFRGPAGTPDENRPHQFRFTATGPTGICSGCKVDYKNFSVDEMLWNTKPIELLQDLPDEAGPRMQDHRTARVVQHWRRLADTRENVMKNFVLNKFVPNVFTSADATRITALFDSFCDKGSPPELQIERLENIMAETWKWRPLPKMQVAVPVDTHVTGHHTRPAVEPIIHSKFTEAERSKALREVNELREIHLSKEAEAVAASGAAVFRGTKHMSKKCKASLAKHFAQMQADVYGRKTNAKPIYLAQVVGAAKHPKRGIMTLIAVADGEKTFKYKWLPKDSVDHEALEDHLLKEKITVWWNDGTKSGKSSPYVGTLCSYDGDTDRYKIWYEWDSTVEMIDLKTLSAHAVDAERDEDMGFRIMWMCAMHNGVELDQSSLMDELEDRPADAKSLVSEPTPQEGIASDGDSDMDVPFLDRALNRMGAMKACSRCHVEIEALELDLHSVTQRPSRHRRRPSTYDPATDGANDMSRLAKHRKVSI
jgi:hypothetical protein